MTEEFWWLEEVSQLNLAAYVYSWNESLMPQIPVRSIEGKIASYVGMTIAGEAKLKEKWRSKFPTMKNLRYLYVSSKTNQRLFDAICDTPGLRRLCLANTSIDNISSVNRLESLTHICIDSSPRLSKLEPLHGLPKLKALALFGNFERVTDFNCISKLTRLKGLELSGQQSRYLMFDSLQSLQGLKQLRYLNLTGARARDRKLEWLATLSNLQYLWIGKHDLKYWPLQQYRLLNDALPNLKIDIIRRAATDSEFQADHRISN